MARDAEAVRAVPAALTALARAVLVGAQNRPSIAPKNMQAIPRGLSGYTDQVLFGDVWVRSELSPRDRSVVTLLVLIATGKTAQMAGHLRRGLDNGVRPTEVAGMVTQLAFYAGWPKASAAVGIAGKVFREHEIAAISDIRIVHAGQDPKTGPADYFTGKVSVASPFKSTGGARRGGATVTFQPGARTNWHTHPLGQLLIVTPGVGWVQAEGEPVREMKSGDAVWIAPGIRHRHAAARNHGMTHVAVAEALEDQTVTWLGSVSDADYHGPAGIPLNQLNSIAFYRKARAPWMT